MVSLFDADGKVVPEVWELGLAVAVRDAVRARELYLSGSRRYVSFWDTTPFSSSRPGRMVYSDGQWERERPQIDGPRSAKADGDAFLDRMPRELDQQAAQTEKGLPDHPYAGIQGGRLNYRMTRPIRSRRASNHCGASWSPTCGRSGSSGCCWR